MIKSNLTALSILLIFTMSCGAEEPQTDQNEIPSLQSTELTANNLRSAALNGGLQTVREAIEQGGTALMYAAAEGNYHVVELLLVHGAIPHLKMTMGKTSVDFVSNNAHSDVVELLQNN